MKTIKRWTSTISSSFDWLISQVENHEALVTTAIREMQQAATNANIQLAKVRRDGAVMRERLEQLKLADKQWEERAAAIFDEDSEKALECMRRKKRVCNEIQQLEAGIREHSALESQLSKDLHTIQTRIAELKRKKNALAAREYRAQAVHAGACEDIGIITELDDIFNRWESRISAFEMYQSPIDTFEEEFSREEEEQELQAELARVIANR